MKTICIENEREEVYENLRTKKQVCEEAKLEFSHIETDPIEHCLHSVKKFLKGVIKSVGARGYTIYVGDGKNFRHELYPEYKAGRPPKPLLAAEIQRYLVEHWDAVVCTEIEADDQMGIDQCSSEEPTIICTIDKDLDMIPGKHFNWDKDSFYEVDRDQAERFFWQQVLMGDSVDNIIGLKGIGEKRALKLVDGVDTKDLKDLVLNKYIEHERESDFHLNCKLLWILRKPLEETYQGLGDEVKA